MEKNCCLLPLQTEIFTRLSAGLTCGVYDAPPDSAEYPYVVIGDDDAIDTGTKNSHGDDVTCLFHVWSRAAGLKEAKLIIASLVGILTRTAFKVSGFQTVVTRVLYSNVTNDPDGVTRHGTLRVGFQLFQE